MRNYTATPKQAKEKIDKIIAKAEALGDKTDKKSITKVYKLLNSMLNDTLDLDLINLVENSEKYDGNFSVIRLEIEDKIEELDTSKYTYKEILSKTKELEYLLKLANKLSIKGDKDYDVFVYNQYDGFGSSTVVPITGNLLADILKEFVDLDNLNEYFE